MRIIKDIKKYYFYRFDYPFTLSTLEFCRHLKEKYNWKTITFSEKAWRFNDVALVNEIKIKYPDVQIDSDVLQDYERSLINQRQEELVKEKAEEIKRATVSNLEVKGIKGTLYNYQKLTVEFAINSNGRALLALDMGTGKSLCSLAYIIHTKQTKSLIICPASMKHVWAAEIKKWTNLKSFVINSKNILSLQEYRENDIIILNYDILKKNFELLSSVMFDCLIVDESAYCFPYNTKISTDRGSLKLGDIVEKNINCNIASYNFENNKIEYQKINNVFKNINNKKIIKIKHSYGEIICTEDHKIYTKKWGYRKAISLLHGEEMYFLQKEIFCKKEGKKYFSFLFTKMYRIFCQYFTSNKKSSFGEKNKKRKKEMFYLWKVFLCFAVKKANFLFMPLCGNLAYKSSWCEGKAFSMVKGSSWLLEREKASKCFSCFKKNKIEESETVEKMAKKKVGRIFEMEEKKSNIFESWRQRSINKTTNFISKENEFTHRICHWYTNGKRKIQVITKKLQSRFGNTNEENSDRNRWTESFNKKMEIFRQKKNKNIKLSRVESAKILESSDIRRNGKSGSYDKFVYNIEVDKNNNYFADGILVSNCKNYSTLRSKIVRSLSRKINSVLLLSGRPILNRPVELFSQLNIIDPATWKNYMEFVFRYCSAWYSPWGLDVSGSSNVEELKERISKYVIRIKKEDVLKDLPKKNFINIPVEIDEEAKNNYQLAENSFVQFLKEIKNKSDKEINKSLQAEKLVKINHLRQLATIGKIKVAAEILENIIDNDQKVVVFSSYNEPLSQLQQKFSKQSVMVIGSTNAEERMAAINKFQKDDKIKIFFGGLLSASTGITLTAANNVLFLNYDWTPSNMEQAMSRIDRIGQQAKSINIMQLIAINTIDQKMEEILKDKKNLINELMDEQVGEIETTGSVINDLFNLYSK